MKKNVTLLISSAFIALTFPVFQAVHGMEGLSTPEEQKKPSGIQLSKGVDDSGINTTLQYIKDLQNDKLTYGELSNVLKSIDKFYTEASSHHNAITISSAVKTVISDMNKDINMQFIDTPQARDILVDTAGHNTRGAIIHIVEELKKNAENKMEEYRKLTDIEDNKKKSNRIHQLLHRNLQEVFGQGDVALRRAAIDELYTEDCQVYVPLEKFVGREALDKFAGDLRLTHPHFVYTPHGEPQALHDAGRIAWGSGPRGEASAYTGLDVIIVRNDKIRELYVFIDS